MQHIISAKKKKERERDLAFFFLIVNDQLLQCHSRETAIIIPPHIHLLSLKNSHSEIKTHKTQIQITQIKISSISIS